MQGALEWLETNQDKSLEEIKAEQAAEGEDEEGPALKPGEEARSLVCNDCGKKFRSQAQAEFHASKSQHVDFSESTEEIAQLTEEQKKQRLDELREKLAAKRAVQSDQDKVDQKRNEVRIKVEPMLSSYVGHLLTRLPRKFDEKATRKTKMRRRSSSERNGQRKLRPRRERSKKRLTLRSASGQRSRLTRKNAAARPSASVLSAQVWPLLQSLLLLQRLPHLALLHRSLRPLIPKLVCDSRHPRAMS